MRPPLGLGTLIAAPSWADRLTHLELSKTMTRAGKPVQITVKATTPSCGFRLDLGDGRVVKDVFTGTEVVPVVYESVGTYTIGVRGQSVDSKPACRGSRLTELLSVAARPEVDEPRRIRVKEAR